MKRVKRPESRPVTRILSGMAAVSLLSLGCSGAIDMSDQPSKPGSGPGAGVTDPGKPTPRQPTEVPSGLPDGADRVINDRQASLEKDVGELFGTTNGAPTSKRLRRLSKIQYENSVADALGVAVPFGKDLPDETDVLLYDTDSKALKVTEETITTYAAAAAAIRDHVEKDLAGVSGCATTNAGCLKDFSLKVASKAFRHDLSPAETQSLGEMFDAFAAAVGPQKATSGVLEYVFQSPTFLYRWEFPLEDGAPARMSDWEVAAQLSYQLTNAPPDEALRAAARAGKLRTRAQLEPHVDRLVQSKGFEDMFVDFTQQWLGFKNADKADKDPEHFPEFSEPVRSEVLTSADRFVRRVLTERNSNFVALLTDTMSEKPAQLASIFANDRLMKADAPARRGVVGLPAFFVANSSPSDTTPMTRAFMLVSKLMCVKLDPPSGISLDESLMNNMEMPKTARQKFAVHTKPMCMTCHKILDPFAFALEHFDPVGAYRDTQEGERIDTTGVYESGPFPLGAFADYGEMAEKMGVNQSVHACIARQLHSYMHGTLDTGPDDVALADAYRKFVKGNLSIRELARELALADRFYVRQ